MWTEKTLVAFDEIVFEEFGLPNVYERYQTYLFAYNANISYQY